MKCDLILQNGRIVTAQDIYEGDILIRDGVIAAIAAPGGAHQAGRCVDLSGKYIFPGMIDPHVHIHAPFGGCIDAHDFYTASQAAAFGGVTTIIDFSNTWKGSSVLESVKARVEEMSQDCVVDFGVHAKFVQANERVLGEIKDIVAFGCPSIKMFTTYRKEGVMIEDEDILAVMREAARWGGLPIFHAENNAICESNTARFAAQGKVSYERFAQARPNLAEEEAVSRVIFYAKYTGCPIHIFHLTSEEGLAAIERAQAVGIPVTTETCPHYLHFTRDQYRQDDGYLYIMTPPLRDEKDRDALWRGLARGSICNVSSDNCTFSTEVKTQKMERRGDGSLIPDFTKVMTGVTGLEERIYLLMAEGVAKGRITLNRLCEITSLNPAKTFGLFPQKGIIQAGSDADLMVIDPEAEKTLSADNLHQRIDYSIYSGVKAKGVPVMTIRRGEILVENGQFKGGRGSGKFLARKPFGNSVQSFT